MTTVPPPSTIAVINGPANAAGPPTDPGDVCLALGFPWGPAEGQTSRSLQPCTLQLDVLATVDVATSAEATVAGTLPDTGVSPAPMFAASGLVLVAGVIAALTGRRRSIAINKETSL